MTSQSFSVVLTIKFTGTKKSGKLCTNGMHLHLVQHLSLHSFYVNAPALPLKEGKKE